MKQSDFTNFTGNFARNAAQFAGGLLRQKGPDLGEERHDQLPDKLPRHVAIIMDGNGRWAKLKNLPRSAGHVAGLEALREIVRACHEWGIEALSVYAFSTENWARPDSEVSALMSLMLKYYASEIDEMCRENVRVHILGDVDGMPGPQREVLYKSMERTGSNTGLRYNIALNYGGRAEIIHAAKRIVELGIDPSEITDSEFEKGLYTYGQPDVDLLIRTSGEMRTSNFLPWQTAYAELVFNDMLWPDYNRDVFKEDLWRFAMRDRRYGKV